MMLNLNSGVVHADERCGYLADVDTTAPHYSVVDSAPNARPCSQCHAPSWPNGGAS